VRRLTTLYGAGVGHLLAMVGCFVVASYAGVRLLADDPARTGLWFAGAAVLHDLVLLPLYVAADRLLVLGWRRHPQVHGITWLGYVRFPAAISALLLLVFGPEIFRFDGPYAGDSRLSSAGYLDHWLIVVAALFLLSAGWFAVKLIRR